MSVYIHMCIYINMPGLNQGIMNIQGMRRHVFPEFFFFFWIIQNQESHAIYFEKKSVLRLSGKLSTFRSSLL